MAKAVGTTPKQLLPFAKVRASLPDSTARAVARRPIDAAWQDQRANGPDSARAPEWLIFRRWLLHLSRRSGGFPFVQSNLMAQSG